MRLIADGGSTKTDWCLQMDKHVIRLSTGGMNATIQTDEQLMLVVKGELLPAIKSQNVDISALLHQAEPTHIYYYGAGCIGENAARMEAILRKVFSKDAIITVRSDLFGAAIALLGDSEGIAAILGTGSNSCLFDGKRIVCQTPPMGYILGDEGSGAVLGRCFLNALFKQRLPLSLKEEFIETQKMPLSDVLQAVYRQPIPNRFLASLSPFIAQHLHIEEVKQLVIDNFRDFIAKNIAPYHRPDLPINAVGSIATVYETQLNNAAELEHLTIGKIIKQPMEELVKYHTR